MARAAGEYDGSLREIIHAFKYQGHRSLAGPLARGMRSAAPDVTAGIDLVVPVPLHPLKYWQRGFNQAEELARGLPGRRLAALRRRRATRPQAGLAAAERAANVRHAFAPSWRLHAVTWLCAPRSRVVPRVVARTVRNRWSVEGRTVLLVDDVLTTGATLEECARVLKACGAREVRALTAALVVRQ